MFINFPSRNFKPYSFLIHSSLFWLCLQLMTFIYILIYFQLKYFNDPILRGLQQLDNIDLMDYSQRAEVYTFLAQVIPSIPKVSNQQHA